MYKLQTRVGILESGYFADFRVVDCGFYQYFKDIFINKKNSTPYSGQFITLT